MTATFCHHASWRTIATPQRRRSVGWYCEKRKAFIDPCLCPVCKYKPSQPAPRVEE